MNRANNNSNTTNNTCQVSTVVKNFKLARRVGTPIIQIQSNDQRATIQTLSSAMRESSPPIIVWDAINGARGQNESGKSAVSKSFDTDSDSLDVITLLEGALRFPAKTVLFMLNSHALLDKFMVVQAVWNLRDAFKATGRTLVLLSCDTVLPVELANDVYCIDEELPGRAHLSQIVIGAYSSAELGQPATEVVEQAVDAVSGLPAFMAEQAAFMSLEPEGINVKSLWERKVQMINKTPGLSVWDGNERFDDIGGIENVKGFLFKVINGNKRPKAIVFIDEIEKALSGSGSSFGDSSGVSQDQLGVLLSWMQDSEATGIICVGVPGTSKSMLAKATGNMASIPTVQLDLGGMKGSLVGESEQRMRGALRVIKAISDNDVLVIATCNRIASLPPELRRRFTFGTFFFDLPTEAERDRIWQMYRAKFGLNTTLPLTFSDDGWTGAEIRQCCDIAARLSCSLEQASRYIVPVSQSAAVQIKELREQASGRYISASEPGIYRFEENEPVVEDGYNHRMVSVAANG